MADPGFPRRGGAKFFPKNAWKWKKLDRGGGAPPSRSLGSANEKYTWTYPKNPYWATLIVAFSIYFISIVSQTLRLYSELLTNLFTMDGLNLLHRPTKNNKYFSVPNFCMRTRTFTELELRQKVCYYTQFFPMSVSKNIRHYTKMVRTCHLLCLRLYMLPKFLQDTFERQDL